MNEYQYLQIKEMIKQNAFRKILPFIIVNILLIFAGVVVMILNIFILIGDKWDNLLFWFALCCISISISNEMVYSYPIRVRKVKQLKELDEVWEWQKKHPNGAPPTLVYSASIYNEFF